MSDYQLNTSQEIWKPIDDFPNYEVSNFGQVRSFILKNGKGISISPQTILKQAIDNAGYCYVHLRKINKGYSKYVHKLVLSAFVGPCPDNYCTCHNDGNRLNNHLVNLRWDTRINNCLDKVRHGTYRSKLSEKQAIMIKTINIKFPPLVLANMFNVSRSTISSIRNSRTWKHL